MKEKKKFIELNIGRALDLERSSKFRVAKV